MTITDLGIKIISTEEDLRLFTDDTYQGKVKEIVNQLREEQEITKSHRIACHKDYLALYKNEELQLVREII